MMTSKKEICATTPQIARAVARALAWVAIGIGVLGCVQPYGHMSAQEVKSTYQPREFIRYGSVDVYASCLVEVLDERYGSLRINQLRPQPDGSVEIHSQRPHVGPATGGTADVYVISSSGGGILVSVFAGYSDSAAANFVGLADKCVATKVR